MQVAAIFVVMEIGKIVENGSKGWSLVLGNLGVKIKSAIYPNSLCLSFSIYNMRWWTVYFSYIFEVQVNQYV